MGLRKGAIPNEATEDAWPGKPGPISHQQLLRRASVERFQREQARLTAAQSILITRD
jgi:hypothetical protein